MQVTQTLSEGLNREFAVLVPAKDLEERLASQLADIKDKVKINGFRPGKVPVAHLRRVYGRSVMAEVVENVLNETNQRIVADHGLKLAREPKITFPEQKDEVEAALEGKADLQYRVALEVLPAFEIADFAGLAVTREVAEVTDEAVEESLKRLAASRRPWSAKDGAAETGDRVTIDFVGTIDDKPFEGGSGTDIEVEIGSDTFVPGFEQQLIGAKAGDERVVDITFPPNYASETLAGRPARFQTQVKAVEVAGEAVIDEDFAKSFGQDDLAALRATIRDRIGAEYAAIARRKLKRQLLDELDKQYSFDLPSSLVDQEFENIWRQVKFDMEQSGRRFEDDDTTEEKAREDYLRIAKRRVRLGLVLAEIGERAKLQVSDEEMTKGIIERARQFPGRERMLWEFYRKNPQALAEIRAPIFEEKVIDHILDTATITDKPVSRDELIDEGDEDAPA